MSVTATIHQEQYQTLLDTPSGIFIADEHIEVGGTQKGMNPHELLLGSLASCTAITLRMYANRKEWPLDSVQVNVNITVEADATKGTIFERSIQLNGNLSAEQKERLLYIANRCPIHKILSGALHIETNLNNGI
ncbi:OsmC family protein [Hydrotalea sp.]|uniref:OsmC family protein n=1 Tax=Hydrotalea sp. TaxID=2881279 RepID=UPI003D109DE5